MSLYENVRWDGFGGLLTHMNAVAQGWIGSGICIMVFIITLVVLSKNEEGNRRALAGAGLTAFVIASIFFAIGKYFDYVFVSSYVVFIFLIIAVLGFASIFFE